MSCLPGCTPQVTASTNTSTFTPVQPGLRLLKGYYSAGALFLDVPIVGFMDGAWPVDSAGVVYDRGENAEAERQGVHLRG
ncbi:hypothetical protein DXM29_05505 [Agrobacterium tumefaciens]|nr:hypothetical protein DXM29_05505 [Agrobacterium tumefaciens]